METALIKHYTAKLCKDKTQSSKITFQKGGVLVEIYKPKHLRFFHLFI